MGIAEFTGPHESVSVCVSCVQRNAVILTSGVAPTPAGRARGAIARISTFSTTVPRCASSAVSRPHCRVYLLSASDPSPAAIRQQQLLPRDGDAIYSVFVKKKQQPGT